MDSFRAVRACTTFGIQGKATVHSRNRHEFTMTSRRVRATQHHSAKVAGERAHSTPHRDDRAAHRGGAVDGLLALAKRAGNAALERLVHRRASDSQGAPLAPSTASRLGDAYGADLRDVRIVDDRDSHAAASALSAQAFAADGAVFVGDRAPPPLSPARDALIAHELAHVAQQQHAESLTYGVASAPADAHERAADSAAASALAGTGAQVHASGSPAAVQRQPIVPVVKKKAGIPRAEAQKIIEGYLTRLPQKPEGKGVTLTESAKNDIRKIAMKLQDASAIIALDGFLMGNMLPTPPADLAKRIAALLPETVDPAALAHLRGTEYDEPAPSGPEPSRLDRLIDLGKKTSPNVGAEAQEQGWKFDQSTSDLRQRDKPVLGPLKAVTPSVDLERVFNIAKGLPKAWKGEKRVVQPRSYPSVDAAVATISATSLVPKAIQGTPQADSYANAQYLAAELARDLDVAQQKKQFTVQIDIGANYRSVSDRAELLDEVERIVRLVRDALPHHASRVGQVEIYIGTLRVRVVTLGGGE